MISHILLTAVGCKYCEEAEKFMRAETTDLSIFEVWDLKEKKPLHKEMYEKYKPAIYPTLIILNDMKFLFKLEGFTEEMYSAYFKPEQRLKAEICDILLAKERLNDEFKIRVAKIQNLQR